MDDGVVVNADSLTEYTQKLVEFLGKGYEVKLEGKLAPTRNLLGLYSCYVVKQKSKEEKTNDPTQNLSSGTSKAGKSTKRQSD